MISRAAKCWAVIAPNLIVPRIFLLTKHHAPPELAVLRAVSAPGRGAYAACAFRLDALGPERRAGWCRRRGGVRPARTAFGRTGELRDVPGVAGQLLGPQGRGLRARRDQRQGDHSRHPERHRRQEAAVPCRESQEEASAVLRYVEHKLAQHSTSWRPGDVPQRQITPQAASSSGQARPTSRLGGAGRPYSDLVFDAGTAPGRPQACSRCSRTSARSTASRRPTSPTPQWTSTVAAAGSQQK